ncbi:MAG: hypothetical protein ACXV2G_03555 [Actinomycetes bacterium]
MGDVPGPAEADAALAGGALPEWLRTVGWAIAVIPVAATVGTFGELSPQAFVAVSLAGAALMVLGLRRRAGSASPAVHGAGFVWLGWLVVVSLWELWMFLRSTRYPTLSDLMDPVLAHHTLRALATVVWFAAGVWLIRRPSRQARAGR